MWAITVEAASSLAVAAATLILAVIAFASIRNTNRIMKEQQRPYVVVDGVRASGGYHAFVILNTGSSAAKDVSVNIVSTTHGKEVVILDEHIAYLPPGGRPSYQYSNPKDDPACQVRLEYHPEWKRKPYVGEYEVDLQRIFRRAEVIQQSF